MEKRQKKREGKETREEGRTMAGTRQNLTFLTLAPEAIPLSAAAMVIVSQKHEVLPRTLYPVHLLLVSSFFSFTVLLDFPTIPLERYSAGSTFIFYLQMTSVSSVHQSSGAGRSWLPPCVWAGGSRIPTTLCHHRGVLRQVCEVPCPTVFFYFHIIFPLFCINQKCVTFSSSLPSARALTLTALGDCLGNTRKSHKAKVLSL